MILLPPVDTTRWLPQYKAAIVRAIKMGELDREETIRRYKLTKEELASWEAAYERYGAPGLYTTKRSGNKIRRPMFD